MGLLKSILLKTRLDTKGLKGLFDTQTHPSVVSQVNMRILIATLTCRGAVYLIRKPTQTPINRALHCVLETLQ